MRISKLLFTNTPLDELEEGMDTVFDSIDDPQICHLCTCNFSLINTKYICFVCRMPVCLKDSSFHLAKSRICDNCQHEILVEEIWKEKKSFKDQIIQSMQDTIKENNDAKVLIAKENSKISGLKNKIIEYQVQTNEEILKLQNLAEELEKVNDDAEKNIECMRDENIRQDFEKLMVEKLARSQEHLQMMRIEIEEMELEKEDIRKELSEVAVQVKEIEIDEVYRMACKVCKTQVRPQMNKSEIEAKVCRCEVF